MGKRGPAPKPTNLKKLQGTDRADRAPTNEPEPEVGTVRPKWLDENVPWGAEAKEEWDMLAPLLEKNQLLTEIDYLNFAALCDAAGRFRYYRRRVQDVGDVQTTPNGYRTPNPEVGMLKQALADMKRFGALFGLSPSDRTRISVPEKEEEKEESLLRLVGS